MERQIDVWLVGNTGLRNPNRIQEGFKLFANSPFVGNLHGREFEIGFMDLLNQNNIINNKEGKDSSASHARKWRLMFAKNGLIYPQVKNGERQDCLGKLDDITPFGKAFLKADTQASIQEFFLRAMTVEQYESSFKGFYFSPLRWMLALLIEIEKRTGSSAINRIEFALWGQTTNPCDSVADVVDRILDLRERRAKCKSKRVFDKEEIAERGKLYNKKSDNFLDYSDMNIRYLCMTGMFLRKGRGFMINPSKHILAEKLSKSTSIEGGLIKQYQTLCNGASLPTDDLEVAKNILFSLNQQAKALNITFDLSSVLLDSTMEVNNARMRLEELISHSNEIKYANEQCNYWKEISVYMDVLIHGKDPNKYDDEEDKIVIPKDETPAYFEWTLWRAALAVDHTVNEPNKIRGFNIDSSFLPISTAGGGRPDLRIEFKKFVILTEVTMSSSSRQEAMEGEPVRRHVSDAIAEYDKPVYGLFIANKIDTNTAETFRNGIWYTKDDKKQRLIIIPLTLEQFKRFFVALFENNRVNPEELRDLLLACEKNRDTLDAPRWKQYIDTTVSERILELSTKLGS